MSKSAENIEEVNTAFLSNLQDISSIDQLEKLRIDFLGRKGVINSLLSSIKDVSHEERREYGEKINKLKKSIEKSLREKHEVLISAREKSQTIDVTIPATEVKKEYKEKYTLGSLHMISYAIEEIAEIFTKLGFVRMQYPEVEWEHFAFEALNMPADHPARDDFETFFIDVSPHKELGKMVLTPHTSSGQSREMLRLESPPIRMINIAKTYRPNWDASHTPMFHQFEGLCVDKGINITHLKGTIDHFAKAFFGPDREIRLRPFHFQFTEPSFEVDITCGICDGTGVIQGVSEESQSMKCKLCKAGWLELGGTGMVHPNVLEAGGIDAEKYSGWAFGFGVERVFMMKEGLELDDLRTLYSNDVRFLEQF